MVDSAIVVLGTEPIIPAMVFAKIGIYSAYIEHYYMHTDRMMILIVEPVSQPWKREYIPAWRAELLETILLKLASTVLVLKEHHTFVNCFMAKYFVAIEILKKLALALEEGITVDEPDLNINIDLHSLFKNIAYGQRRESSFYAPHLKGSFY